MALSYLLEYAGTPFVPDMAQKMRVPLRDDRSVGPVRELIRPFQPEPDLLDEINRLLPFDYLHDYAYPNAYPGRNLGNVAYRSKVPPGGSPTVRINDWYYPPTASRWSVFRGLATSSMVKEMLLATDGNTAQLLVMKAWPESPDGLTEESYTLETYMHMLPPRPIGENGGTMDGLYLITLVDERYYFQGTPVTLHLTQDSTWDSLIAQVALSLGVAVSNTAVQAAYGKPELDSQLWCNYENAATLLDALAANIGRVVVRNLVGTYHLLTPEESLARVNGNRGNAGQVVREMGGDLFTSGTQLPVGNLTPARGAVVPAEVVVTFPKYIRDNDPIPHFLNPRYASGRASVWEETSYGETWPWSVLSTSGGPLVSGLVGTSTQFIHTTAKALYSGEIYAANDPLNASGLKVLAGQVAQDFYSWQVGVALDEVYPGTFAWIPEGFHDIIWTYSCRYRQAGCRVTRTEWNQAITEFQHANPPLAGDPVIPIGVGGKSVPQTWTDATKVQYGVNSVRLGTGLSIVSGIITSGGVSEVTLQSTASGGAATSSGDVNNWFSINNYFNYLAFIPITVIPVSGTTFNPGNAPKVRLNPNAPVTVTGIAGGTSGRILFLHNISQFPVKFVNGGAGLDSVWFPLPQDCSLWNEGEGWILEYDGTSGVWRPDHPMFGTGDASGIVSQYTTRHLTFGSGLTYGQFQNGHAHVELGAGLCQADIVTNVCPVFGVSGFVTNIVVEKTRISYLVPTGLGCPPYSGFPNCSGPQACCSGVATVESLCCSGSPVPMTIFGTPSDQVNCNCISGPLPFQYNSGLGSWILSLSGECGLGAVFALQCSGLDFEASGARGFGFSTQLDDEPTHTYFPVSGASCDPFLLTYSGIHFDNVPGCSGTFTITFTE